MIKRFGLIIGASAALSVGLGMTPAHADQLGLGTETPCMEVYAAKITYDPATGRIQTIEGPTYKQYQPLADCIV